MLSDAGSLALPQVPAMLRRRLSPLGKCAFKAALALLEAGETLPSVFVSRHGETQQTLELLQELVKGEPLSPTAFSLSVHNAISGVFSIARNDVSSVTALAAAEGPLFHGLLEACGMLQSHSRVLCVFYEAPLPDLYRQFEPGEPFTHAIALLLSRDQGVAYQLQPTAAKEPAGDSPEALELIACLLGLAPSWQTLVNAQRWQLTVMVSTC